MRFLNPGLGSKDLSRGFFVWSYGVMAAHDSVEIKARVQFSLRPLGFSKEMT